MLRTTQSNIINYNLQSQAGARKIVDDTVSDCWIELLCWTWVIQSVNSKNLSVVDWYWWDTDWEGVLPSTISHPQLWVSADQDHWASPLTHAEHIIILSFPFKHSELRVGVTLELFPSQSLPCPALPHIMDQYREHRSGADMSWDQQRVSHYPGD